MKGHSKRTRTALLGSLLLITAGVVQYGWRSLSTIANCAVEIDPNLSKTLTDTIRTALTHALPQTHSQALLCTSLQQQFACIQSIDAHLYGPHCAHYTITAHIPKCLINNSYILTSTNKLMPRTWYNEQACAAIPTITIQEPVAQGSAPVGLYTFICHLPHKIWHEYTVTWHSDCEIHLVNKSNPTFTIVCNADHAPDETLLAHCEQLYTTKLSNEPHKKNHTAWLSADIRFANQIVIHADQGGKAHG